MRISVPGIERDQFGAQQMDSAIDIAYHAVLPSISLVFGSLGAWVLSMRAMMISVQGDDYILFAKSRGVVLLGFSYGTVCEMRFYPNLQI